MAKKTNKIPPLMQVYLDQQTAPHISESAADNWVQYGTGAYKNQYPQFIIDLYNSSPTHAAVVNATSAMIAGDNIVVDDGAEDNLDAYVKLKKFLAQANRKETLHEVLKKISFDLKLQGGFALNIIWSQDRTTISEIYHVPVERVRCGKLNEWGQVDEYWLSADWSKYRQTGYIPKPVAAFNPSDRSKPSQLLYKGMYSPGMEIYHTPDYQAGTNWCLTDQLISEFHLSNIRNGFSPNFWINFNNGIPTEEERYELEKKIQQKFTGASNAGKFVLTFSDDKSREPTLQPISLSDADKQYEVLNKLVIQNIMIAHRVTSPMLLGVKTEGQLGGRTELLDAYELYHNTVISPFQDVILKCIRHILDINDINLSISIQKSAPMNNKFGADVLKEVMTVDELREELGLPALADEDDTVADEQELYKKGKKKKKRYKRYEYSKVGSMITDGIELPLYDTIEEAEAKAESMGCTGYHEHTMDGTTYYMPCENHEQIMELSCEDCSQTDLISPNPCQPGYEPYGHKIKRGKKVPNCVPMKSELSSNSVLDEFLATFGEYEEDILKDYELISEETVEDETEDEDYEAKLNSGRVDMAVKTGKGYPNRKSKQDGTGRDGQLFRVRYIYTGSQSPERPFCKAMMAAGKVYRKEDILAMSRMAVNPGWGPNGKNTYSIWKYKGGKYCYHKWFRKIYLQKGNRAINDDEVVSTSEARRQGFRPEPNPQEVPVAPIDMPNRGGLT